MKISYNWLRDYLPFDLDPARLAEILTDLGLEVESMETWESVKGGLQNFVIGEVLTCVKHPNADKLSLTTVSIGAGAPLKIVCGAPNVSAGQKVLVALPGAKIFSGNETFEIKKTKIRGEESEGMICAEDEAGMGTSHEGIMVLDQKAVPGTPASEYFGVTTDTVYEIGLTPNRIDAASHYGIARDLAARLSLSSPVKAGLPELPRLPVSGAEPPVKVVIENTEGCRRYAGWYIRGVKVGPSPAWLQNRLRAVGLNPISNVVDITNYVLYETGQPLHAFDADKIQGNTVVVKNLPAGTMFITLDGVERTLEANDLLICNTAEPMALAGIFGGLLSGISDETTNIFLESAWFDPRTIRRTARRLGLATDASFRFERGTDPNMVPYALQRAAWLITSIAGGTITGPVVDEYPAPAVNAEVGVNLKRIYSLIGKEIPEDTLRQILASLDIEILSEKGNDMLLRVPPYRVDVQREADIVEEVLRIYGFNNVEIPERVHATLSYVAKPDKEKITHTICDYLTGAGFTEIMSNSLTRSAYYEKNKAFPAENLVRILNPLSSDLDCMRQSLLYGGLEAIRYNRNRKNPDLLLYEVGKVYFYHPEEKAENPLSKYSEYLHLALFATGNRSEKNWTTPEQPVDFFFLKGWVSAILQRLGFDPEHLGNGEVRNDLFEYGLKYMVNETVVVEFGEVNAQLTAEFDCKAPVFYADFHWDALMNLVKDHFVVYREIPRFPEVRRDLSMVLDEKVTYAQLRDLAFRTEKKLLQKMNLFDVYKGEKIGAGKKSYAITYVLRDPSKTLTDEEIDAVMRKLMTAYEKELGAVIRQ